jgi:Uma2 family endonuclease
MANSTLPAGLPVSDPPASLNDSPYIPSGDALYEVVDGRIVELPPIGAYESDIANFLAQLLDAHARKSRLGRVFLELLFRIDTARNLKRRPDLAFVSAARWPFGKRVPRGEAWDMVPDLAVEVISPSNGAAEIACKIHDYFQTGTLLVWVIYPETREVYVYTSVSYVQILIEPAELDGGDLLPGFRISLDRLFEDEQINEPV